MKLILVGLFVLALVCFVLLNKVDGFQNSPRTDNSDIKGDICAIYSDTLTSIQNKYNAMDKTNEITPAILKLHMDNIKAQMVKQGC